MTASYEFQLPAAAPVSQKMMNGYLICLHPFGLIVGGIAIALTWKRRDPAKYVCITATILSAIVTFCLVASIANSKK
jgi:hypothetical protein